MGLSIRAFFMACWIPPAVAMDFVEFTILAVIQAHFCPLFMSTQPSTYKHIHKISSLIYVFDKLFEHIIHQMCYFHSASVI